LPTNATNWIIGFIILNFAILCNLFISKLQANILL